MMCTRYDIIEFTRKFPWLEESGTVEDSERFRQQKTIDLFEQWDQIGRDKKISLKRIADTTVLMKQYLSEGRVSESFLDDLDWQHKYLIECMDSKLMESVLGKLKDEFDEESQGGPLTFAVMIERCINLSHDAIDALRTDFSNFTLASIPEENVEITYRDAFCTHSRGLRTMVSSPTMPSRSSSRSLRPAPFQTCSHTLRIGREVFTLFVATNSQPI